MAPEMKNPDHSTPLGRRMRAFEAARSAVCRGFELLGGYLGIDQSGDGVRGAERRYTKRDPVREAMSVQNNWTNGADSQTPEGRR